MSRRSDFEYTDFELRQIVAQRRRELTARDVELRRQQNRIEAERARVVEELAELDKAEWLLE